MFKKIDFKIRYRLYEKIEEDMYSNVLDLQQEYYRINVSIKSILKYSIILFYKMLRKYCNDSPLAEVELRSSASVTLK